ncbi:alpha/beta fold hydrolase [Paragemmobacter straminiformis]|uniref:Alpha/beta hydrolase n=1 Tax=Paragemmobacter straminiformis TaxID=2045119 RepID=A0A842I5T7_9RHOB|nr:alpha/beta hydrolase [Gemmobacter straminiformis]MBC2834434.1 alpha/beta hydrolase [Gemmobacter straminiformis]
MPSVLHRDGLRLTVHDAGGAGRPVIFQHGLCGDARQTFEAFPADPRLRCLTLDCRGHGTSDFDPQPGLAKFAQDVAALAETLGQPVAIGGISMGAAIALRLAVTRPELVSRLFLVRPAWGCDAAPPNMAPNAEVGLALVRLPVAEARAAFLSSDTAQTLAATAPDNLNSLRGFFDRTPVSRTAILLNTISRDGPGVTPADLGALRLPTLVAGCAEDAIHPLALSRDLAALIPAATHVTLPPKGSDKPAHLAALHRALTDFLT